MGNEEKKTSEGFSGFLNKASDFGKKAANAVSQGAKDLSDRMKEDKIKQDAKKQEKEKQKQEDKIKQEAKKQEKEKQKQEDKIKQEAKKQEEKKKKLNPLTPKEYKSKDFHIPNIIMIVDDAVRRDNELCEGAIGWREVKKETEILCLYDEWIRQSGIRFVPQPTVGEVYFMDRFDRTRFIRVEDIFRKAHEERLAELERIAYCLGAKRCTVEVIEKQSDSESQNSDAKVSLGKIIGGSANVQKKSSATNNHTGRTVTEFSGSTEPKRPELKWFKNEDNILNLIEMRCSDNNSIKSRILELAGTSITTMSQKMACAIDSIMNMKVKASISMEKQAKKEHNSILVFEVEF